MANPRNRAPLFIGAALIVLIAAGWVFFSGGFSGSNTEAGDLRRGDASPASVPTAAAASEPTASREAATVERVNITNAEKPLPAAYERALSGIIGRVVEPDGRPVKNASVELIGGLLEFFTLDIDKLLFESDTYFVDVTQQKQSTNEAGEFRFAKVDPRGYYIIGVNLGKGRPALRLVDHTPMPGESVDLGDIALDPWLTVRGRLVDERGKGVSGARVRVTNIPAIAFQAGIANIQPGTGVLVKLGEKDSPRFMWRMPKWTDQIFDKLPMPASVTVADGSFAIEGSPSGQLTIIYDGPGIPAGNTPPIPQPKGSEKDLGDINISRGAEVDGVVVDQNDAPVGNSEVTVGIPCPIAAEYVAFLRKPIKTDAAGRFVAKGIPGQKAYFIGRGPGQVDWTIDKAQEITGDEIKVKIPAPRSILVIVQDGAAKPLAARVAVQRDMREMSLFPQIETPLVAKPEIVAPGQYRIRGLKQGPYLVYARAEGYAIAKEKVEIAPEGEPTVTITCEPEFSMEVTVLGKENGKPVPLEMATVAGFPENKSAEKMGFLALGSNKTDENGVARVRALGEGKFNIVATHPAYAMGATEAQLPGSKTASIQLLVGGEISGTVTRAGIPPEKPMMVVLAPGGGDKTIQLPRTSITILEGKFHFSHIAPGHYKVAAVPRLLNDNLSKLNPMEFMRFASENADQDCDVQDEQVTEMVIDLAKGGRKDTPDDGFVRGSVYLNGVALEGAYVMGQGPEWIRPKKVDASGAFDLGRAREGDYTITVTRGGSGFTGAMQGPLATRRIKVKATEETSVNFNIRTGALKGTVVDEAGKAVAGARVRVVSVEENSPFGGGPPIRTDDAGRFEISEIASGAYRVNANFEDAQSSPMKIEVREGATEKIQIILKPGVEASGTIEAKFPEGATWAWMQFQQKSPDGDGGFGGNGNAQVDLEKHTFTAKRLSPGKYNITLSVYGKDANTIYKAVELDVPPGGVKNAFLRFEEASPEEAAKQPAIRIGGGRRGR